MASPGTSGCRLNMVAWPSTPPDYSRSLSCAKPRGVRSAFLQIYVDHGQAGPQRQMEQKPAGLRPTDRGRREHENITPEVNQMNRIQGTLTAIGVAMLIT